MGSEDVGVFGEFEGGKGFIEVEGRGGCLVDEKLSKVIVRGWGW